MKFSENRRAAIYRHIEEQANRLEEMAAQLRRDAKMYADNPYLAAEQAVHTVAWGVANLNQSQLVSDLRYWRETEMLEKEDSD